MEEKQPSIFNVFKSVLASFFGVQSSKVRERDFQYGKPMHYIIMGIVLTIVFIFLVIFMVQIMLKSAGA